MGSDSDGGERSDSEGRARSDSEGRPTGAVILGTCRPPSPAPHPPLRRRRRRKEGEAGAGERGYVAGGTMKRSGHEKKTERSN